MGLCLVMVITIISILIPEMTCFSPTTEKVTRKTIGVKCCPVAGIPEPAEQEHEEEDLNELTHELNLQ